VQIIELKRFGGAPHHIQFLHPCDYGWINNIHHDMHRSAPMSPTSPKPRKPSTYSTSECVRIKLSFFLHHRTGHAKKKRAEIDELWKRTYNRPRQRGRCWADTTGREPQKKSGPLPTSPLWRAPILRSLRADHFVDQRPWGCRSSTTKLTTP
jgi:hypothetical protein